MKRKKKRIYTNYIIRLYIYIWDKREKTRKGKPKFILFLSGSFFYRFLCLLLLYMVKYLCRVNNKILVGRSRNIFGISKFTHYKI